MEFYESFNKLLQEVHNSYMRRIEKEAYVWKGFDEEVSKLTFAVSTAFGEFLNEIGSVKDPWDEKGESKGGKILGYKITYDPRDESFNIKVNQFKFPDGKMLGEDYPESYRLCLGGFYEALSFPRDQRIKDFMEKYNVKRIKPPKNRCCPHK